MTAQALASKFRRALRNETGATFTLDQMRELAEYGYLKDLAAREADEICPESVPPSLSGNSGSTNGGMANHGG